VGLGQVPSSSQAGHSQVLGGTRSVNVTQSDESDKDDAEEGVNYLAFGVSYESEMASESNSQDKQDVSEIESEEEGDMQKCL
jgi:hypothetical protein